MHILHLQPEQRMSSKYRISGNSRNMDGKLHFTLTVWQNTSQLKVTYRGNTNSRSRCSYGLRRISGTFNWWDRGFESRWGYGCLSLLFVVSCVNSGLCEELITASEDSYRVCDLVTSKMRWPNYELHAVKLVNKGSSSATGVYCCHLKLLFVTPTETYTTKYWKHFI